MPGPGLGAPLARTGEGGDAGRPNQRGDSAALTLPRWSESSLAGWGWPPPGPGFALNDHYSILLGPREQGGAGPDPGPTRRGIPPRILPLHGGSRGSTGSACAEGMPDARDRDGSRGLRSGDGRRQERIIITARHADSTPHVPIGPIEVAACGRAGRAVYDPGGGAERRIAVPPFATRPVSRTAPWPDAARAACPCPAISLRRRQRTCRPGSRRGAGRCLR